MIATFSALFALAPAHAASLDYYLKIDGIDGELAEAESAIDDITGLDPEPVGLLLPAIQKVREAAASAETSCKTRERIDESCVASVLAKAVSSSDDGRDPALSLLDLYALGTGTSIKTAKLFVRKQGADQLFEGLLLGLYGTAVDLRMPDEVVDPIDRALDIVATDPTGA